MNRYSWPQSYFPAEITEANHLSHLNVTWGDIKPNWNPDRVCAFSLWFTLEIKGHKAAGLLWDTRAQGQVTWG